MTVKRCSGTSPRRFLTLSTVSVKSGKARSDHIPSGLLPRADIVDAFLALLVCANQWSLSPFAERALRNVGPCKSVRLDIGRPDDLSPFLGLVGD